MNNFEYKEFKLKEIASFEYGKMPDKTRLLEKGYPVYSGYRIVGYYPEYMYEREKLLIIARGVGGTGDVKISPPHSYVTNLSIIFNENEEIVDYRYLYYYLSNVNMRNLDTGSCQSQITINQLEEYKVRLPKINIQHKLSKVLTTIESKIELNNRINAELEAMAKTLYDYWFVQFDFPDENGKPYKSSGGKMVWNEELKREIPEGWDVKKLKDFAKTGSGGTPLKSKPEYYVNGNIPWINSGEVNASFIVKAEKYITEKGINNSSAKLFKKGTILMAMYGATAGQVSLIDFEASTNQAICGINPHNKEMTAYLKFGLEDLYNFLISLSSGSARDNLSQDKIRELYFVIPKHETLSEFDRQADAMLRKILLNLKENQKLTELRDWLLPMLMNGQVKVN